MKVFGTAATVLFGAAWLWLMSHQPHDTAFSGWLLAGFLALLPAAVVTLLLSVAYGIGFVVSDAVLPNRAPRWFVVAAAMAVAAALIMLGGNGPPSGFDIDPPVERDIRGR